jgi:aminoglycoside phosphotransferase (APT) family kinase protein
MMLDIKKGAEAILRSMSVENEFPVRWESKVLREVSNDRAIILYTFYRKDLRDNPNACLRLIGKFYSDDRGWPIYQKMEALQGSLSRHRSLTGLSIPKLVVYDKEAHLIVQQYLSGISYYEVLDKDDFPKYFRSAGEALAILHSQDLPFEEKKSVQDHLEELIHPHPMDFCEALPQYRQIVKELVREMVWVEGSFPGMTETTPIHRDFHLRQLFYGENKVWLIDWDLFTKGDPVLDVGNFLVYLETHLQNRCAESKEAFLEGYFSIAPPERRERIFLYKAVTYLRLACKSFRLKKERWEERVEKMISLGEECLFRQSIELEG